MDKTPLQSLATYLLGEPVENFLRVRRDRARPVSWRKLAAELRVATNGQVDVTQETVRKWYVAADVDPKSSAVA